ncbi:McrC family protein [Cellulomonas hominis]
MSHPVSLTLTEGGRPEEIELPDSVVEALVATGVMTASRTATPGRWEIAPANKVGVVSAVGVQVSVLPKIMIDRIVFMLGYARSPQHWRDTTVDLEARTGLPEALAHALVRHSRDAMWQGLLQGYVRVEETSSVLRGRIRDAEQVRRWFGRMVPLEVAYDDYTVDIIENRLLLSATLRLLRAPGIHPETRRALRQLRLRLAEITPLTDGMALPDWTITRLNQRYAPALAVAELVLRSTSFDQRFGTVAVSGFLVSMHEIFEDFVCTGLRGALERHGGRGRLQWPGFLDVAREVPIRPDLVWEFEGLPRIVADAKYKAEKPAGFPQADLYQLLAYCTALGLPDGHLVYARGNQRAAVHQVRGTPVRIHCHTLDLEDEPAGLLSQLGRIAEQMLGHERGQGIAPDSIAESIKVGEVGGCFGT